MQLCQRFFLFCSFGLLALVLSPAMVAAGFPATPTTTCPVGKGPRSVTVGDFDGNGSMDMAVANELSNNVSVLLRHAGGCGFARTDYPVSTGANPAPTSIDKGHFRNGAGWDLVVANTTEGSVAILRNNGDGTFAAPLTISGVGSFLQSVVVADFNGDGLDDVAVVSANPPKQVVVLLNQGSSCADEPCFTQTNYPLSGMLPWGLAVGRFRGPGSPLDLAVSNYYFNTVSVLLGNGSNNGDGTFQPEKTFVTMPYSPKIVTGQFTRNFDNRLDIAVTNYVGSVSTLRGNGSGSFSLPIQSGSMNSAMAIAGGEFDGVPLRPDIVVTNYYAFPGTFTVLNGNGDGTFTQTAPIQAGKMPVDVAVGRINGDAKDDLVIVNQGSNNVMVFLQN